MVSAFSRWRRYDETRQALAKVQLLFSLLCFMQLSCSGSYKRCYYKNCTYTRIALSRALIVVVVIADVIT